MKETMKQKLDEKQAEVAKLWGAYSEKKAEVEEDAKGNGGSPKDGAITELKDTFYLPYQSAVTEHDKLKADYIALIEQEAGPRPDPLKPETKDEKTPEHDSPGDRFARSAQYKALLDSGLLQRQGKFPQIEATEVMSARETKDLVISENTDSSSFIVPLRRPGYLPFPQAPLQVRNLVTVREVGQGNSVEWVRQLEPDNQAVEVPEATTVTDTSADKPESAIDFTVENTPILMIAHYIPITRVALQDIPQMRDIVNQTLVDGVNRRLNGQMLNGAASPGVLTGILNTTGVNAQSVTGNPLDGIYEAMTTIRTKFFEPNAVLMNPSDWRPIRLSRSMSATTGDYLFGPPSMAGDDTLWGKRVVLDPTIAKGTALVGDFTQAVLYVRDGITVYTTDSHSDWFTRNIIAILAEGRFGFAVERPQAFLTVDMTSGW